MHLRLLVFVVLAAVVFAAVEVVAMPVSVNTLIAIGVAVFVLLLIFLWIRRKIRIRRAVKAAMADTPAPVAKPQSVHRSKDVFADLPNMESFATKPNTGGADPEATVLMPSPQPQAAEPISGPPLPAIGKRLSKPLFDSKGEMIKGRGWEGATTPPEVLSDMAENFERNFQAPDTEPVRRR